MLADHLPLDVPLLASIPARWIDQLEVANPHIWNLGSFKKVAARGLSLLISVTVFPLFLGLDGIYYSVKTLTQYSWTWLQSCCGNSGANWDSAVKCKEVALKCFRGMAAVPTALVWRDMVSNHFLPELASERIRRPKGGLYPVVADIRRPQSVEELQALIKENPDKHFSISGAGYCQGKQTLPPRSTDIMIDMTLINSVKIDPERQVAVVGGGATWGPIEIAANAYGLALLVRQASNPFSAAGSLGADCHGWDPLAGTLANTVNAITIVNAQGELQRLTPDDELFGYVAGGYGWFGVVVEMELQLTPNEELFDVSDNVAIEDYPRYFREQVQRNPNVKLHLYRLSLEKGRLFQEGWAESYTSLRPAGRVEAFEDEPERGTTMERIMVQAARLSDRARNWYWKNERKAMTSIRRGTRNQFMRPKINAALVNNSRARTEWLQEYFLPEEQIVPFLKYLASVLNQNEVSLLNASVRFVPQTHRTVMGYAAQGDRYAVVLYFTQCLNDQDIAKTEKWIRQVVDRLGDMGGTFYLPYAQVATPNQFKRCHPAWKKVQEMKLKIDPDFVFHNGLFQHYFA